MIILGVDPGTLITGYGIIESFNGRVKVLACDAIKNPSNTPMPARLNLIFNTLTQLIRKFHPDEFAIETAFYGKNAQSALKLGHARGVAMLAAVKHHLDTHEYSPREVKRAIVGNGNASKIQVQYMIGSMLKLSEKPKLFDTTDALAVAICHLHRAGSRTTTVKSWKAYLSAHPEKLAKTPWRPRG